jgi:hypothetical protein
MDSSEKMRSVCLVLQIWAVFLDITETLNHVLGRFNLSWGVNMICSKGNRKIVSGYSSRLCAVLNRAVGDFF